MAKGQTNSATSMSNQLWNQALGELPPFISGLASDRATQQQNQTNTFNNAYQGYLNQQQTGGFSPTQLAGLRSQFSQWAPTGGMDPAQVSQVEQGYGNLAATGGWSQPMQAAYMRSAAQPIQQTASAAADAARRAASAGGGSAQAAIADISQGVGAQQASAIPAAALGLNQQITANQLQGLGGQAGFQGQLAGARQGVGGLQAGLEGAVAQGVQGANAGLSGLFGQTSQNVNTLANQQLAGLGLQFGTEANAAQIMQALSKNPGLFQTGLGDIVSLLGALPSGSG